MTTTETHSELDRVAAVVAGTPFMSPTQARRLWTLIHDHRLRHVLELGFAHGVSTCYLAAAVAELPGGRVTTIDQESTHNIGRVLACLGFMALFAVMVGAAASSLFRTTAVATAVMVVAAGIESGAGPAYLVDSRTGLLQLARGVVAAGAAAVLLVAPRTVARWVALAAGLTGVVLLILAGHASALSGLAPILAGYLFGQGFSLQTVSIVMGCGSLLGAITLLFVKFESTSEAVSGGESRDNSVKA